MATAFLFPLDQSVSRSDRPAASASVTAPTASVMATAFLFPLDQSVSRSDRPAVSALVTAPTASVMATAFLFPLDQSDSRSDRQAVSALVTAPTGFLTATAFLFPPDQSVSRSDRQEASASVDRLAPLFRPVLASARSVPVRRGRSFFQNHPSVINTPGKSPLLAAPPLSAAHVYCWNH